MSLWRNRAVVGREHIEPFGFFTEPTKIQLSLMATRIQSMIAERDTLARQARRGDRKAASILWRKYHARIYTDADIADYCTRRN